MLRESEIAVSNFLSYKKFFKSLEAWSTHEFENLLEFLSISFVLMKKICLPHKISFFCVVHRPATHPDLIGISQFFSTNLGVSRFPDSTSENPEFLFRFEIGKTKGISLCCMARVSKPTKFGLKINAMIGWILCTPRLSEWSRLGLASLSRRPELGLTWCHSSADPRNCAGFEGSSHLSSIPPIFPPYATIWPAETGKVNSKIIIQRNSEINKPTKLINNFISAKQLPIAVKEVFNDT